MAAQYTVTLTVVVDADDTLARSLESSDNSVAFTAEHNLRYQAVDLLSQGVGYMDYDKEED